MSVKTKSPSTGEFSPISKDIGLICDNVWEAFWFKARNITSLSLFKSAEARAKASAFCLIAVRTTSLSLFKSAEARAKATAFCLIAVRTTSLSSCKDLETEFSNIPSSFKTRSTASLEAYCKAFEFSLTAVNTTFLSFFQGL